MPHWRHSAKLVLAKAGSGNPQNDWIPDQVRYDMVAITPVLNRKGRVKWALPFLITVGKFPEACLEFVIPSKEGIQTGCPLSRA
jgi:hypothetical protein